MRHSNKADTTNGVSLPRLKTNVHALGRLTPFVAAQLESVYQRSNPANLRRAKKKADSKAGLFFKFCVLLRWSRWRTGEA
ncbi:hypothetical protein C0039_01335 [Pseudohalioglobus lutimaris]|uniref:Uncharacterized protein n=1 Tax=Pseudohalioglobus lutimaris TaxID=1737061 RepID=A0A2N5X8H9_9GAMM|nr:hypothetical protein C0039_01335 [Pseudohalioglobus lutimaris]